MRRRTLCSPTIQSKIVVIGVDIAKNDSVAVAQAGDGTLAKPLKFKTSTEGFAELLRYAKRSVKSSKSQGFVVSLEPTGHYGLPLLSWLLSQGVTVYRVEPLHTNRVKELYDGTRRKTDSKDAAIVADLCRRGVCRRWELRTGAFAELRVLTRRRQQLVKQRSAETNRLHRHLDVVFPELRGLFGKVASRTVMWLLKELQTPAELLALGLEELTALLLRGSRGQLGRERAEELRSAARATIGTTLGLQGHALAIRQVVTGLEHTLQQLGEVEKAMGQQLARVPYAERMLSIPKLGAITAASLLGELGDLRGYRRSAQLVKMAGLDLVETSSGQRRGKRYISRRGRAYARQMLYLAALRMGGGVLKEARRRMVEENKVEPTKAAVANMCRLLRILHALVRDDVDFDASLHTSTSSELPAAA